MRTLSRLTLLPLALWWVVSMLLACSDDEKAPPPPSGGDTGPETLVRITELAPGEEGCEMGGVKIEEGLDENENGELDDEEVETTYVLCDGADIVVPGDDPVANGDKLRAAVDDFDAELPAAIALGRGSYDLGSEGLSLPEGLSLRGRGLNATHITSSAGSTLHLGSGNSELETVLIYLTVEATGPEAIAVQSEAALPRLSAVRITAHASGAAGSARGITAQNAQNLTITASRFEVSGSAPLSEGAGRSPSAAIECMGCTRTFLNDVDVTAEGAADNADISAVHVDGVSEGEAQVTLEIRRSTLIANGQHIPDDEEERRYNAITRAVDSDDVAFTLSDSTVEATARDATGLLLRDSNSSGRQTKVRSSSVSAFTSSNLSRGYARAVDGSLIEQSTVSIEESLIFAPEDELDFDHAAVQMNEDGANTARALRLSNSLVDGDIEPGNARFECDVVFDSRGTSRCL